MTVDELIASLQRSSLPTVLVEGPGDAMVFRSLEKTYAYCNLSVLPAGGRKNVLGVYDRRNEINNKTILFIADKDIWCLSSIPDEYNDPRLIFTEGYSIENDLHMDYDFCRLMTEEEKKLFQVELEKFIKWYALSCSRKLVNDTEIIDTHPNAIISSLDQFEQCCRLRDNEEYPYILRSTILCQYQKLLRGKSMLALLLRQLSNTTRTPKHSAASLLEVAAAHRGHHLVRILDKIGGHLPPSESAAE